jgi:site-specific recombinase XerD
LLDEIRPAVVKPDDHVFISNQYQKPLSPNGVGVEIKREMRRAGLPDVGATHAMRRTFATALDNDGCPVIVREALLGHIGAYAVPHDCDLRKWGERADAIFLEGIA